MHNILSVALQALQNFSTLSHNREDIRKKVTEDNMDVLVIFIVAP